MLPQTLPIRFVLNHRKDTTQSSGPDQAAGPGWAAWTAEPHEAGRGEWANEANGPWPSESSSTPLLELEGLGKALGLETLWLKEWGRASTPSPPDLLLAYAVMARETLQELEGGPLPTHVFLQAGNGDLAAAMAGHFRNALRDRSPRIIVVEPANADCVLESVLASMPTPDSGSMETNMKALACREISRFAWGVLKDGADAFLSISDYAAEATVDLLREGVAEDPSILIQPSGAAGLAGLIATSFEPALTEPLKLGPGSRVLVLGWEGPA